MPTGIVLRSGERIDADVIVTATGLQLQALGGVALSIDGAEVKPQDRFVYKEHMLEDVPNAAWCVGYINASWTLRADLTARAVAKLLAYMDSHGYTHAYPHLGDVPMPEKPAWNINAGYVQRALHALPKSGTHRPWNVRHNYVLDAIDHRFDRIEESMVFGRVAAEVRAVGLGGSGGRAVRGQLVMGRPPGGRRIRNPSVPPQLWQSADLLSKPLGWRVEDSPRTFVSFPRCFFWSLLIFGRNHDHEIQMAAWTLATRPLRWRST